jgi:S1-C subfamily serine protease
MTLRHAILLLAAIFFATVAAAAPPSPEGDKGASNAEVLSSVVTIQVQVVRHARGAASEGSERRGTGVVVEPAGLILTSAFLVQEADSIVVTTFDSRTVAAVVAAQDATLGVAVLRPAAPLGVRPLPIGSSTALAAQAPVAVAAAARARQVAVVTVVAKGDFAGDREYLVEDAIFTAPLVHECAGAALVDGTGKLVGVGALPLKNILPNAEARAPAPGNVFIPVEHFLPVLAHVARADGSRAPRKPWLGLVTEQSAAGLVVTDVPRDSPAERAGLRVGDTIAAVDGKAVRTHAELYRHVWRAGGPGTEVRLTIVRGGATREMPVRAIDAQDYLIHRA